MTIYALGTCPASPQIGAVVSKLLSGTQGTVTEQDGAVMTLAQLQGTLFFKTTLCTGGPALQGAVSSFCGSPAFSGWYGESQVACQNCTQYDVLTVILCQTAKEVVVLEGTYGWDS